MPVRYDHGALWLGLQVPPRFNLRKTTVLSIGVWRGPGWRCCFSVGGLFRERYCWTPRQGRQDDHRQHAQQPVLKKAIDMLADDVEEDYWKPTRGNAKRALCGLLALAQLRPDGVWDGD